MLIFQDLIGNGSVLMQGLTQFIVFLEALPYPWIRRFLGMKIYVFLQNAPSSFNPRYFFLLLLDSSQLEWNFFKEKRLSRC
ncbi:hypothetical protein HAT2_00255 [Candidatus Similichlamydia laticola]|uniref:Uncharacterized protein n=1 Tax=Candidatus Similichlamydia laticola TaxID=2170265 RepID=A0A369KIQ2_9BACT|nr:hypothetical protein HAT2_00255 [Candidatus Similichlamydia laticola]